jgi:hypothetical protein
MSSKEFIASRPNFNQNVENARVLIEDAPWRDNPAKYRKVAEGILRRILTVDPGNESAKRLLAKAVAAVPRAKAPAPVPLDRAKPSLPHAGVKALRPAGPAYFPRPVPSDLAFVVQRIAPPIGKKKPARSLWGLVGFMAVVAAIAAILMFVMYPSTFTSQYAPKSAVAVKSDVPQKQ